MATDVLNLTGRDVRENDTVWWDEPARCYVITTGTRRVRPPTKNAVWLGVLRYGVFAAVWMGLEETRAK